MRKFRILVVDDDPRIVRFIRSSLVARGYEVFTAANGDEALTIIQAEQPDIMLLDIFLPVKDGFEVLKELRAFSEMPVLAFSANNSTSEKALSLGAIDFVAKPFTPDELVRRMKLILNRERE